MIPNTFQGKCAEATKQEFNKKIKLSINNDVAFINKRVYERGY